MIRLFQILLLILLMSGQLVAQGKTKPDTSKYNDIKIAPLINVDGDTIPQLKIPEVKVYSRPKFKSRKQARRYSRLVKNVKKVYPYAIFIKLKIDEINIHLQTLDDDREKKKFIRQVQREITAEFEDDVRHMTFSQGKILIKLVDRETGETSYDWLKELKGDLFAGFWQAVARIFGSNLKMEFDAQGEDILIDQIVRMIDAGLI